MSAGFPIVEGPGWWPDMPEDVYHRDPVAHLGGSLSASMCKVLIQPGGPAKLRQQLDHPRPPKAEFDIGHAAHKLVLGVGADLALIPHDEWRTKEAKAAVAAARDAGQIPLRPADWDRVHAMADRLADHELASRLLADVTPEVSAVRRRDSVWLRARFDAVGSDYLADFKTARSADPECFRRDAGDFGYHLQAAAYIAMSAALDGLPDDPDFFFVVQEKEPPYLVSVVELSETFLAIGAAAYEHSIALWAECVGSGEWPGYPAGVTTVDPPPWLPAFLDGGDEPGASPDLDPDFEAHLARLAGMETSA